MLDFTNASILPGTLRQRSHPTPGIGDRCAVDFLSQPAAISFDVD